jgi:ubiquinol-cytochrome c reductase cytochrome c1 subunit
MTMKKILSVLIVLAGLAAPAAWAQETIPLDRFPTERANDLAALQHGAKIFVNYCLNCHNAAFMRYNRMHDIGLTDQQIKDNLLFASDKVGDLMKVSMDPKMAKEWFGVVPPDLSLIARSRAGENGSGADYLYTYLRTFYKDDDRPTGWNNLAFPKVAMPNVLWELQGIRKAVFVDKTEENGEKVQVFDHFEQIRPGTLTPAEYDSTVADLVAYLQWMGEPAQNTRVKIGVWVLFFLGILTVITWRLNAAYWKDVK